MSDLVNTSAGAGVAQQQAGRSINTFLSSLWGSLALFGVQFTLFYLLRNGFARIYRPKTYLVPEKTRIEPPPGGFWQWIVPVFKTSNAEFIAKCGLDAYFFVRFLRLLLKIFVPVAFVLMPVLIPINSSYKGNASTHGLDRLGWQNFDPARTDRLWSHLILAVLLILWFYYVVYDELIGYIRVRQAYLTSPQHRLRASATTVLVTSIPPKWLTREALIGLYDAFPGGIRNIWINRDFDVLNNKIKLRNKLASKLEQAETNLILNAQTKAWEMKAKEEKAAKIKHSKAEKKQIEDNDDEAAMRQAMHGGMSSGDPHQAHTLAEELGDLSREASSDSDVEEETNRRRFNVPGLGRGVEAISHGIQDVGQGFSKLGKKVMKGVVGAEREFQKRLPDAVGGAQQNVQKDAARNSGGPEDDRDATAMTDTPRNPGSTNLTPGQEPTVSFADTPGEHARQAQQHPPVITHEGATPPSSPPNGTAATNLARSTSQRRPGGPMDWTQNDFLQAPAEKRGWKIWKVSHGIDIPSPQPHRLGDSQFPFDETAAANANEKNTAAKVNEKVASSRLVWLFTFWRTSANAPLEAEYPPAFIGKFGDDQGVEDAEPEWKKYLKEGDRDKMRLPLFGLSFMPYMPSWTFIGKKVDTIYYCRREVARLNLEIEQDQSEPEKYPLMNSAFIQFNQEIAAHMASQCLSHHQPNRMSPRYVEIAPNDIIWDNLSIKWWERFIRIGVVFLTVVVLIVFWAIPVSFTSGLSNLTVLSGYKGFHWVHKIPKWPTSVIEGILPWLLLTILLALIPLVLRLLATLQGVPTGMDVQLSLQNYYFGFLFVQLFVVNTIASGLLQTIQEISKNPAEALNILAKNIPSASNYYFSYMLLQAFSTSASNIAQIAGIAVWFLLRPILDKTARQKFHRIANLNWISWGSFFPMYTVLACIGLIYAIIAPLIVLFNIITFSLFWFVFRYQSLYINVPHCDTGGLLFPRAINQLFAGVYMMEFALIGMFILVRDSQGNASCIPQAGIMAVMAASTIVYQFILSLTFSPLYRYMPITLEDDAVDRDEAFQRIQEQRWAEENGDLPPREKDEGTGLREGGNKGRSDDTLARLRGHHHHRPADTVIGLTADVDIGNLLYGKFSDQIEDLTAEERDILVQRAFQHEALRARRPVIWIPQDHIGVSEDEIRRTSLFSEAYIWISNEGAWVSREGKVMFTRAPPDFAEVDLVEL